MIKFTNILIHILIARASGINMELSASRNYEIRSDLPRLTVSLIDFHNELIRCVAADPRSQTARGVSVGNGGFGSCWPLCFYFLRSFLSLGGDGMGAVA